MVPEPGPRRLDCPTCFHSFTKPVTVGSRVICPMCENFFRVLIDRPPASTPVAAATPGAPAPEAPAGSSVTESAAPTGGPGLEVSLNAPRVEPEKAPVAPIKGPSLTAPAETPDSSAGGQAATTEADAEEWDLDESPDEGPQDLDPRADLGLAIERASRAGTPDPGRPPDPTPTRTSAPSAGRLPISPHPSRSRSVRPDELPPGFEKVTTSVRYIGREMLRPYREATLKEILGQPLSRARVAGLLLLAVFVLGSVTTLAYTWLGYAWEDPLDANREYRSNLQVQVQTDEGKAIVEAEVQIRQRDITVVTDSLGKALLPNLPEGDQVVRVSKSGYNNVTVELTLRGLIDKDLLVILEPSGQDRNLDYREASDLPSPSTNYLLAALFLVCSLAAFAAASFALTRRNYRLALGGATLGVLSFGFLVGSLLSLVALLLLIFSPQEFNRKN